jgi:hypothetical protein
MTGRGMQLFVDPQRSGSSSPAFSPRLLRMVSRFRIATTLGVALAALALSSAAAATAGAATSTFGSPLSVPATLNTAENLGYSGSNVALPGSTFHIAHDGADTALWNVSMPVGAPTAPTAGQVTVIKLEGCAERPAGAPEPLVQIHFQDLVPTAGGGARINLTAGPYDIPVCGVGGASGSTVTTYEPFGLCVSAGDYVDFNDEGGFVPSESGPPPYPAGVPYMVIGSVPGATMDSFVRNGGTNNGDTFSPSDTTFHDGFVANQNEELMLQATLATGPDAMPGCGGTKGVSAPALANAKAAKLPLRVSPQTDGINHRRLASVAMFCRLTAGCKGTLTLTAAAKSARLSHPRPVKLNFSILGGKTVHLPVRVPAAIVALARKRPKGVSMRLTAIVEGKPVSQTIVLRIF